MGARRAGGGSWGLFVIGLGLWPGCKSTRSLGDPEPWTKEDCLATLAIDHQDAPLTELRELGGQRDDFQDRFPAAEIDAEAQRPVSAAASLRMGGRPIAWYSPPLDAVVLDGAAFAPLRQADPTRARAGERLSVGRVTPKGREALGGRGVVELLIRIGVIQTYWHLGADLCLSAEREAEGIYRASWRGVHQYATNTRNEARFGFEVEIDEAGEVVVIGAGEP